ncbi:MAG: helix-turn-helix domain-containing protein [Oscillospiraceae bacterium]|nr:helix-turn-helix domain-containing protein [Oscillospiraceae bacterium]
MPVLEAEASEQRTFIEESVPFELLFVSSLQEKDFVSHLHEQTELQYVLSGRVDMELNGERVWALPGDLLVVNAGVAHREFSDGTPTEKLVLTLETEPLYRTFSETAPVISTKLRGDVFVGRMAEELVQELREKEPGYRVLCQSIVMRLMVYLLRNHVQTDKSLQSAGKPDRIKAVSRYIDKHYMEALSNKVLARLIHVSESRFIHLFKEEMGMSPLKYINTVRLHKAKSLLERGECSVMEVAALVGFSDYNHFGRMFRENFGCTPVQARRNGKK